MDTICVSPSTHIRKKDRNKYGITAKLTAIFKEKIYCDADKINRKNLLRMHTKHEFMHSISGSSETH